MERFIRRATRWAWRQPVKAWRRSQDGWRSTYSLSVSLGEARQVIAHPPDGSCAPEGVIEHYLAHRFDLLGSGWVRVSHGTKCRGLENGRYEMGSEVVVDRQGGWLRGRVNDANLEEAQRVWTLVDAAYDPIDWHLDFKSGYRWREDTWYHDIRFGMLPGMDVKVPWELSRMQHLPQLASVYARSSASGRRDERLPRDFRNQVLDFIATNPPRFGVNWACAMDVGIRVSNWVVAYGLFTAAPFDEGFRSVLSRSIYEHAKHIVQNLEWYDGVRGNHYLANIAGLLFAAAALPRTEETDAWLAFAVQELIEEVQYQFHPSGANFEGATAYHRLSAEIVIYATALTLGLPKAKREALAAYDHRVVKGPPSLRTALPTHQLQSVEASGWGTTSPFPGWYFERLERMAEFVVDITKSDGRIHQVGDNDSGRFLKICPVYYPVSVKEVRTKYANLAAYSELPDEADYWMEDHLDARHVVAAAAGLIDRPDLVSGLSRSFVGNGGASGLGDSGYVRELARCRVRWRRTEESRAQDSDAARVGSDDEFLGAKAKMLSAAPNATRVVSFPIPESEVLSGLTLHAYPDFGLYVLKARRIYLAVRCWSGGSRFLSAHFHNDQLALELVVDGENLIVDPGAYLYTANPEYRNRYRSVHAHFTPWTKVEEPARLDRGLFQLPNPVTADVHYFGPRGFWATINSSERGVARLIELQPSGIMIVDHAPDEAPEVYHDTHREPVPMSIGYGIQLQGTT